VPSAPSHARSALFAFLQHRCVQRTAHRHNECIAPSIPFANSHTVPTVIVSFSARPQPQPEERKGLVGGPVPVTRRRSSAHIVGHVEAQALEAGRTGGCTHDGQFVRDLIQPLSEPPNHCRRLDCCGCRDMLYGILSAACLTSNTAGTQRPRNGREWPQSSTL
jgi:hypothetical protein